MQRCVTGIFWMSECAKASQYAFFFYTSVFKIFCGRQILCFQGVLPYTLPPPTNFNISVHGFSWPDALPDLKQAGGKQRRKPIFLFLLLFFLSSFCLLPFHPAPTMLHWLAPQGLKHLPCSMCFVWVWDKLQGTKSDGGSICLQVHGFLCA